MHGHFRARGGVTLVEVLVVLAIIGVLLALMFSAVQMVRQAACRVQCTNNMRQIGLALHHYHDLHGAFPPGDSYQDGADPHPWMTWETRLLPFLEQDGIWRQSLAAYAEEPDFHGREHPAGDVLLVFCCPADSRTLTPLRSGDFSAGFSSYLGCEGTNQFLQDGVLYLDSHVRMADITDGLSNTLLVGERPPSADRTFGWWYACNGQNQCGSADCVLGVRERNYWYSDCGVGPYTYGPGRLDNDADTFHFWSLHPGGANFIFADASVHFLPYSAVDIMPALATRTGNEIVALDN